MRKMFSENQIKEMINSAIQQNALKRVLVSVEFDNTDDVNYQTEQSGMGFIPNNLPLSLENVIFTVPIILHDDTDKYDWILLGGSDDNSIMYLASLKQNVENRAEEVADINVTITPF